LLQRTNKEGIAKVMTLKIDYSFTYFDIVWESVDKGYGSTHTGYCLAC